MDKTTIFKKCNVCNKDYALIVRLNDLERFNNGEHVQDAFPYLVDGLRELLISGICGPCFDNTFADEQED